MAAGYRDKYLLHPTKIDRITGYFLDGPPDVPTARFQILFALDQPRDYCIGDSMLPLIATKPKNRKFKYLEDVKSIYYTLFVFSLRKVQSFGNTNGLFIV